MNGCSRSPTSEGVLPHEAKGGCEALRLLEGERTPSGGAEFAYSSAAALNGCKTNNRKGGKSARVLASDA